MATAVAERSAGVGSSPQERLFQVASGFQLSACLYVATKLKIADLLAHGPRKVEALAAETSTNADALYRVLRALVSIGIFSEPQPHTIALSAAAEPLRSDVPGSVHGILLWAAD